MNIFNKMLDLTSADAILITDRKDIYYLTKCKASGPMIITRGRIYLLSESLEYDWIKSVQSNNDIKIIKGSFSPTYISPIIENMTHICIDTINMTQYIMLFNKYPYIKFEYSAMIQKYLRKIQSIKTPEEKELIRRSTQITEEAFKNTLQYIKPGVSEKFISQKLKEEMMKIDTDVDIADYDIMVSSGINTSFPHSLTSERLIEDHDLILIDAATKYKYYNSDFTRIISIGNPSPKVMDIFNLVNLAEQSIIERMKTGVSSSYIVETADKIISENYPMKGAYGHGIGLGLHEYPTISTNTNHILEEGMVIAIEPAIYIESEFGIRIENIYSIENDGIGKFNTLPNDIIIL